MSNRMEPNLWAYRPGSEDHNPIKLTLSAEDRASFDNLPPNEGRSYVMVEDEASGFTFTLRRRQCGASCYCAAEAELMETHPYED